jgi:DNA-binding transcriptional MerR regulator
MSRMRTSCNHHICVKVKPIEFEDGQMRIGELAERTGTSRRLLRYYEDQQLIFPDRSENGYRDYDARYVDRVAQIRGLLDVGIPTRIIRELLPCLDKPRSIHLPNPSPKTIATLERERDLMTARIESLTTSRDALDDYLEAVTRGR